MPAMKFTTGAVVGFAVGYYLGTRAAPEHRARIDETAQRIAANEQVQSMLEATEPHRTAARSILSGTLRLTSRGLRAAGTAGTGRT